TLYVIQDTLYKRRLAYDELLVLQTTAQINRATWQHTKLAHAFSLDQEKLNAFISSLPFELTQSQINVTAEIISDLSKNTPMNRLLEGDVGSGKTVIAAIAAYITHLNGFQSVILAPTQILALQHYQTVSKFLSPFNIDVGLVTANMKKTATITVGTHALLKKYPDLDKVGLVVIDEQHRFGVTQRAIASSLGKSPHILTMTATPIPRSLALTLYGDLDLSVLDESPKNRLPIKTWVVPESKRENAYQWISNVILSKAKDPVRSKQQAFIVCPLINDSSSETLVTVKAVTTEFDKLKRIFGDKKLGLLHGRLSAKVKDAVIADFRSGKIDILVATPVVEVGVDVPGATIMVIEAADRFGLAQLHQLRGRVGRGDQQSYCLLFSDKEDSVRLKHLETKASGHQLAELDLKLRGSGNIFGTTQHGLPMLKVADYSDLSLIAQAGDMAKSVYPNLSKYPTLHSLAKKAKIEAISPN
ncbi:MAG: ATP-dependent DNA helicase RecG, partial [Patescibacteria group bacterium]